MDSTDRPGHGHEDEIRKSVSTGPGTFPLATALIVQPTHRFLGTVMLARFAGHPRLSAKIATLVVADGRVWALFVQPGMSPVCLNHPSAGGGYLITVEYGPWRRPGFAAGLVIPRDEGGGEGGR